MGSGVWGQFIAAPHLLLLPPQTYPLLQCETSPWASVLQSKQAPTLSLSMGCRETPAPVRSPLWADREFLLWPLWSTSSHPPPITLVSAGLFAHFSFPSLLSWTGVFALSQGCFSQDATTLAGLTWGSQHRAVPASPHRGPCSCQQLGTSSLVFLYYLLRTLAKHRTG